MAVQRFKVDNDYYNIPEEEINNFLQDMPNAVKMKSFTYKAGNDIFHIPEDQVLAFKKDMPNAYPILGNVVPKELTPEQQKIKSRSEAFVAQKSEQAKQRYEAPLIQAERKALEPLHESILTPLVVEALASTAKYSGGALSFVTGGKLGKGMYEAGTQLSKAIKPEYIDSGSAGEELKNIYKLDEKGAKARKQFITRGAYGVADQAPLLIANTGAAIAGVGRLGMLANTFFTSATSAAGNKFIQLDDSKLSMLDKYINSSLTGAIEGATEIITNPVQNAMVNSFLKRGKRDLAIQLVKKKLKDTVGKSILRGGAQIAIGEPSEDVLSGIGESIVDNWTGLNKERYAKNKNVFEGVFDTYANSLASSLLMSSPAVAVNTYHTAKEVNFRDKYGLNDEQVTKLVDDGYQIDGFDKEQGDVIFSKATDKGVEKVAYNKETGEFNKTRTAIETDQSENLVANTYDNNDKLIDTVQIVTGQPEQITPQDIAEQAVTENLAPEEVQTEEVIQEQPVTEKVTPPVEQVTETIPVTEKVERETIEPVGNPDKLKIDKENIVKGIDNVLDKKDLKGTDVAINLKDLQKELKLTKPQFKEMLDNIFAGDQISGDLSLGFSRDMKNKVYGDYATISKVIPQEVINAKETGTRIEKGSEQEKVESETPELLIKSDKLKIDKEEVTLSSVNPTGNVFIEYTPEKRAKMPLADNITTLDKTMNESPNKIITIYRGAPKKQKSIVSGDFITTNKQLAKDYAGTGIVLEKKVKLSDILDDNNEPLGEEYIYKPQEVTNAEETGTETQKASEQEGTNRGTQERIRLRDNEQNREEREAQEEVTVSELKIKNNKPLPKFEDNYLKNLSEYTNEAYREMSVDSLFNFIPSNVIKSEMGDVFLSRTKDLALGQEENKNGVIVKFNLKNSNLKGRINSFLPGWKFAYENGEVEFIAKGNKRSDYINSVESVTFPKGIKVNNIEKKKIKLYLLKWDKKVNEDGSITYTNPKYQEVKDEKSKSRSQEQAKKEGMQVEQATISQNGEIYSSKSKKTPKSKKLSTINDVTQAISKVLGSNVSETNIEGDKAVLKLNNGGTLEINMFNDIMKVVNLKGAVGAYRSRIIEGKLSSLIKISRNYNEGNTTAYHEAFHMAFDLFLQSREKTYLQTKFDNIEDMADSFADYCYKQDERGYVGKLFDKILRAIVNFTKELFGADSAYEVEAIFRGLYEGQYKLNPKFETEMLMWGWYQKGTNYKSVSDENKADSSTPEATKRAESKKTTAIKEVFDSLTDGKYELFKNEKGEIKNSMLIPATQLWIDKFKPAMIERLTQPLPTKAKDRKAEKEYRKKAILEFMEVSLTPNMKKSITYSNFKKAINKAKKSKTYLNNFNKLLDNVEKVNKKVLYNLFKKKLSIKKYKDSDLIKQIKYYSKLSQDQVLEIDRELSLQDIDNLDIDTQFMVETYGNLKDKSASGMLNAYAQLNFSQKENATSLEKNKKKMTDFYKDVNDEIIKNLKLTSTEQKIFERNSKSSIDLYLKESKKKIPLIDNDTIQQYLNNSYTFQTKMNLLDNSAYNGYFYNTFFRPLHEALANKEAGMLRWAEHVDDIFIRAFGEMSDTKRKNLKSEMIRNVNDDYNINAYDKDGVAHKLNISPAILIQMYLQWNDEAQRTGLIRNEFTERTYNEVLEEMKKNKGYLEFANGIKDEFFTTYGNELNEVYTKVNGFSLDLVKNYFPIHREIADNLDPVSKDTPFVFTDIRKVSNVHLLNRIDNNNPVRFGGDIFTTIDNHISTMEHYKAFAVVGEVIRKTIGASKTLDAVSLRKGKIFADGLKADLVDINAGSTVNDKGSALKGLMYKFYKAVLTFNLPVGGVQVTSAGLIGSVGESNVLEYMYNFNKFALNVNSWKEAEKFINRVPMLRRRYSHLLYNYDAYYSQSVSHKKINKISQTWDNLTDNVNVNKMGDKVAVMWGGYTLYKLQFDKYVKQGMTELEADKKAISDVEIAVNTTQQSGEILYTPRILRDKGLTRIVTMFQSQQAALFNMQISNLNAFIYDIKNYKTNSKDGFKRFTKNIARKYSSYLLLSTACNLLYTLMRSGMTIPSDDKEKIKWLSEAVIKGIVGNFIVVGDLLNTIVTSLIFRESPTTYSMMKSVSSPVIQQTVMSTEAFIKYANSDEKLSPPELWEATRKIQPLVLGYPVDIGSRMIEGTIAFKDDPTYHNFLRTLGWSDKALKY